MECLCALLDERRAKYSAMGGKVLIMTDVDRVYTADPQEAETILVKHADGTYKRYDMAEVGDFQLIQ